MIDKGGALISRCARSISRDRDRVDWWRDENRTRQHWGEIASMARTLDRVAGHVDDGKGEGG